jgi:probable HAF family extracellular repeat protein
VNDYGEVVGDSGTRGDRQFHAFSWTRARGMVDLGTLGRTNSGAVEVNARGQIIGYSVLYAPGWQTFAVMWEPITNLGCSDTLAGCNLKRAELAGAYLKDANLSQANLKEANFTDANLSGANLIDCNLKDANLRNANLTGARLQGAGLNRVIWSNTICPDGSNSNANGGTCLGHL